MSDMSMGEEAYFDALIEEAGGPFWITKDGRRLRPKDFEDQHLLNTIAFLRRRAPIMQLKEAVLLSRYLNSDPPDGACMAVERELAMLGEGSPEDYLHGACPVFPELLDEAESRGLDRARAVR